MSGQREARDADERDGNSLGVEVPGATTNQDLRTTVLGFCICKHVPSPCDHVGENCGLVLKEKVTGFFLLFLSRC